MARSGTRGLSGKAPATSSKRRAATASKMNGSRSAVRRLGLASIGTQQRNPCKTSQWNSSTDRAQQVIVTSRTLPRPRKQERIQKFRGDLLDAANLLLNEVPVQDVQDILLRTKATADRAFVSEILLHSFAQDAMEYRSCSHCRTSSPSPQPPSRRDSIATLL